MRVMGIDPGSRVTGFGVIDGFRAVAAGTIPLGDAPLPERLRRLHGELERLIREHAPAEIAIEGIFVQRAPRSALVLGHARGVALLCAAQAELPIHEYPPATVKRSLTTGGAASKLGVARAVMLVLGLRDRLAPDASDALAIAICHLSRQRFASPSASGRASAWTIALAAAPPRAATPQNRLLAAALRRR